MDNVFIHHLAEVDTSVLFGSGCSVWGWSHIREKVSLGSNVTIGEHVYIGPGVNVGANSKIQNGALIYDPAVIEVGVFIGPYVVLTNDKYPRAIKSNKEIIQSTEFQKVGVTVRSGASIGAGAVCIAPVEIGSWALVSAGSVVSNQVPPFALVAGNPAKFVKWVGRSGVPLKKIGRKTYLCPKSEEVYEVLDDGTLVLK
jgi:acetyltransferase-like isoleucine patch superfamily enzyme